MPILFQVMSQSPKPEMEKKPASLTQQQKIAIVKEAHAYLSNSMKILGFNVEKLEKSGDLSIYKKAKPAKKPLEKQFADSKAECEKMITALDYLNKRIPPVSKEVREGRVNPTKEQEIKLCLEGLLHSRDLYPDGHDIYNMNRLLKLFVLESTPTKK